MSNRRYETRPVTSPAAPLAGDEVGIYRGDWIETDPWEEPTVPEAPIPMRELVRMRRTAQ